MIPARRRGRGDSWDLRHWSFGAGADPNDVDVYDTDVYDIDDGRLDGGFGAFANALERTHGALRCWPGVAALGFLVAWSWAVRYPTPLVGPVVGLVATVGLCWSSARAEWVWRGFVPGRLRPSWAYRLALPVTAASGLVLAYWPMALQRLSALEEVRRCR
jgi:hypothetical protein